MANNNQLTYQTATIDPTVAGYAARDPGFALGLMLGRGLVNNYNERGERKLRESLLNSDGTLNMGGNNGTSSNIQETNNANFVPNGVGQTGGTQGTDTPQIFAVNANPIMASVPKYTINTSGASQPMTDVQRALINSMIDSRNATQSARQLISQASSPNAEAQSNSLKDRAYAILHDPNNAWSQSAERGAIYNRAAAMGAPGNGNPYAIGNYDDPSRNFAMQAQMNNVTNRYVPSYDAQTGAMAQTANNYANNPLQGLSNYTINTGANQAIQGIDPNAMTLSQMQSFVNGETPQTTPILNAVQGAQQTAQQDEQQVAQQKEQIQTQAMPNLQNIKLNNPVNFTKAEQDNSEPVQQKSQEVGVAKNTTTTPTISKTATTQLPTINTANGTVTPFTTKDWIARVTQAGMAQGRPLNQIQNVIAQTMPMAQAAEDNYRNAATNALSNRIFQGDETTGGMPLIPNGSNDSQVLPQLLSTIQQLEQVNPEAAERMRNILPNARDAWTQNVNNLNKARDVRYSEEMANQTLANNIKQHQAFSNIDSAANINLYKQKLALMDDSKKQQADMKYKALLAVGYNPQDAMRLAILGSSGSKTGTTTNGDTTTSGTSTNDYATVDGVKLTSANQLRAKEIDSELQSLSNSLDDYMKKATKDDNYGHEKGKGATDDYGKAIEALQQYYNNLSAKDKALIPSEVKDGIQQQLYAANYRRQYLAGYGEKDEAIEYLKALTPETRARYGITGGQ